MKRFNKNIFTIFVFVILFMSFVHASDFGETIVGNNYEISRDNINRIVNPGELFEDFIGVKNTGKSNLGLTFSVSGTAAEVVEIIDTNIEVLPDSSGKASFLIKGKEGVYEGILKIGGGVSEEIPIAINVEEKDLTSPYLLEVKPVKKVFDITKNISFQVTVKKIKSDIVENVSFDYLFLGNNESVLLESEVKNFTNSESFIKEFLVPESVFVGEYYFQVKSNHSELVVEDRTVFILKKNFFDLVLFGFLPMWVLVLILSVLAIAFLTYYIIKKRIESKKKYKMKLDLKTLPKKSKENLFLGKIAETSHYTYFDPNKFTTHSIVAGATGGGKSITAQVLIEECLMKGVAVVVFDPTAQWSGMLRKCTDKKMMSFYPKFGLKPKDSRGFKGNVRMIKNARQKIDLNKYISPGQIQIFSLNKLDPKDMDMFVASIIRQIFKSDPKEYPGLKVLLVFDEVHRLLPKFGGSGEGFLQIERGCREFRKWGLGIMLVSQVLNDFMGAIKANISTEVQMRTRDEGDLNRIKTKYGDAFLQSLVKASVGVGMFANPAYNHAQPYFVNFRPILHNTRRLTDEELEEYNKYNDQVDEIEYQVEKLEEEKVDVFDLKMELKLIKDKIMSGSFSVVEIYLEGLAPRVAKEWEKLGKPVPKMEIELISEEEIQASIAEAKEKHDKEKAIEDAQKKEAEEVKVKIEDKIVPSITFDNGAMISSLKEMIEYLPSMDDGDFSKAVNEEKNDIQKWVSEQFGENEGKKLEGKITKDDIIAALGQVGKEEKKTEKKESEGGKSDLEGEEKKEEGEEK